MPNPEAAKLARQLWDKLLTRCGNSYYLVLPPKAGSSDRSEMWQYSGVRFEVAPRAVLPAKRANGVQWEGVAAMHASAFRSRIAKAKTDGSDRQTWEGWKPWAEGFVPSHAFLVDMAPNAGDPPNVIWLRKSGAKWSFWTSWPGAGSYSDNLSALDEIARRKPSCTELAGAPPGK